MAEFAGGRVPEAEFAWCGSGGHKALAIRSESHTTNPVVLGQTHTELALVQIPQFGLLACLGKVRGTSANDQGSVPVGAETEDGGAWRQGHLTRQRLPGLDVPEANLTIVTAGQQGLAVSAESEGIDS